MTDGNKKIGYLVETALLGHGLYSIKDDKIVSMWPENAMLTWVEDGEIKIGEISEFIHSRNKSDEWARLDGISVEKNDFKEKNAFLTASGTMAVAKEIKCPIVVTAGIGGIGEIKSEQLSYDLPALSKMGVTLIATSPKDMLNLSETFKWLHDNNVNTYGFDTKVCNGYLFKLESYELGRKISGNNLGDIIGGCNLILNPIPEGKRLQDLSLLDRCISCGKEAEDRGEYYHPAVNACFDKLSNGMSSTIQLESLVSNINVAKKILF